MKKLLFLSSLLILVSCQSPREKALKKITESEQRMREDTTMVVNRKIAEDLITSYTSFAEQFPSDSLAPEYLFRAAEVYSGIVEPHKAIELHKRIFEKYRDFKKASYSLFLQGFIYETQLKDVEKAKIVYQDFLNRYPTHHMARDVSFSLQNLGKSDEELIKQFEAQTQGNTN